MSWLVSSIANSLKLDDDGDHSNDQTANAAGDTGSGDNRASRTQNPNDGDDQQTPTSLPDQTTSPRGVKQDLSDLSQTLTRQFWGVASFLAPPPQTSNRYRQRDDSDTSSGDPDGIFGIRNDLSEIGGKFRTGISKLSSNKAVSEITKIASNLLQFASEEELSLDDYARRGVVGVTEEVVAFVRDIALHPKTWLDFPLPDDDGELDFDLSDAQQEHALAVERLAPELAALRIELCLGYMSEAWFWKIYFVLVHSILSQNDAEVLSTPDIVRARAMLAEDLPSGVKQEPYETGVGAASVDGAKLSLEGSLSVLVTNKSEGVRVETLPVEPTASVEADIEMDKHSVTCPEIPVIDKTVLQEVSMKQTNIENAAPSTYISVDHKDEDDADDWLKEEHEVGDEFKGTSYRVGNDDDITFSDLEEEDEMPWSSRKERHINDKVRGDTLKIKESNGWLDIEDIDDA